MNNTDKLLRAFIEASGFEIKKIVDTKETPISKQSGLNRIFANAFSAKNDLAINSDGSYKRGDDECYYLKASMEVDYKVTKKVTNTILDVSKGVNALDSIAGLGRLTNGDNA